MTAQISDTFRYHMLEYAVAGLNGPDPFDPKGHGLNPFGGCSALWHGFHCTYALADTPQGERLILAQLSLFHEAPPPDLNGVGAQSAKVPIVGNYHYEVLNLPLEFTGSLLIARGFLKHLYVHMGFHPAWKYENVLELDFVDGLLRGARDRSEAVAEVRARALERGEPVDPKNRAALEAWIEGTFDRSYRRLG